MSQIIVKKVDFTRITVDQNIVSNHRHELTGIEELAENIWTNGLINPLSVVQIDKTLALCAGFRRHAALTILSSREGFDERFGKISVTIAVPDEGEDVSVVASTLTVVENLQREDLTPAETANGISQLAKLGLTQTQIAQRIGKTQAYVSTMLKIVNDAIPSVWDAFCRKELSVEDAVGMARLDETEQKKRMGEYTDVLSNDDDDLGDLDNAEIAKKSNKEKKSRAPSMAGVRVKFAVGAKKADAMLRSIEEHGTNPVKSSDYVQGVLDAFRALLGKAELPFSIVEEAPKEKKKRGRPKKTENVNAAKEAENVELDLDDDDDIDMDDDYIVDDDE